MTTAANGAFARALIANLAVNGVRHFVLCPGSRSGPLAHALSEAVADDAPRASPAIEVHVRIDERTAGFVALGLAEATDSPVAVVTTSGTAVGNLLPAVMEAHHSGARLILLTADRPFDSRGTGSNQTTDQRGIFGHFVQWSRDVLPPTEGRNLDAEARELVKEAIAYGAGAVPSGRPASGTTGPVHLNLQFSPPLGPDYGEWRRVKEAVMTFPAESAVPPLPAVARGLVIAGHGAGPAAASIAAARDWPLFAEPTSGARAGHTCVGGYGDVLELERGQALVAEVEFVLVVGRPTLSRAVSAVIARAPLLWVARHGARWSEAPTNAGLVTPDIPFSWLAPDGAPAAEDDADWLARWKKLVREEEPQPWGLRAIAEEVLRAVAPGEILFVGSSGPIRALDAVLPIGAFGDVPRIMSNRGLAGIDGTIATAIGLALADVAPVTAFMGDVTFVHDASALLIGPLERRPDLRIVIANDGGGTIFSGLEHGAAKASRLERVFTTPHGARLGAIAWAFGARHVVVRDRDDLAEALADTTKGIDVIEAAIG